MTGEPEVKASVVKVFPLCSASMYRTVPSRKRTAKDTPPAIFWAFSMVQVMRKGAGLSLVKL